MLNFQDFSLVLVPGNRLSCLPRARREACGAARAPRESEAERVGGAPTGSAMHLSERPCARAVRQSLGLRGAALDRDRPPPLPQETIMFEPTCPQNTKSAPDVSDVERAFGA